MWEIKCKINNPKKKKKLKTTDSHNENNILITGKFMTYSQFKVVLTNFYQCIRTASTKIYLLLLVLNFCLFFSVYKVLQKFHCVMVTWFSIFLQFNLLYLNLFLLATNVVKCVLYFNWNLYVSTFLWLNKILCQFIYSVSHSFNKAILCL